MDQTSRMRWVWVGAAAAFLPSAATLADYKDDIRYTQLQAELGASTPDGSGVRVGQVEAHMNETHWGLDTTLADLQLDGRTITHISNNTTPTAHAAEVARRFFGVNSMTPKIPSIQVYAATWRQHEAPYWNGFIDSPYLRRTGLQMPVNPLAHERMQVVNHSWMHEWTGGFGGGSEPNNNNIDVLRRLDYVIHTQNQVHVAGVSNTGQPLVPMMSGSFNAIAVGVTSGQHVAGAKDLMRGNYTGNRVRPDMVAPESATSYAAPLVSSAAALLIDTASREGYAYGAKPQVIKAALMAGADKNAAFGTAYTRTTANGLSSRYGAGELDVYNSYHIIAAGAPVNGGISRYGFDYNPSFNSSQTVAYAFQTGDQPVAMQASLVWHLHVYLTSSFPDQAYFGEDALYDLDLALYDVTDGETLIQSSLSTTENTENLWLTSLAADREFELRVFAKEGQATFTWDYALAWSFSGEVTPVPEPAGLTALALGGLLFLRRRVH